MTKAKVKEKIKKFMAGVLFWFIWLYVVELVPYCTYQLMTLDEMDNCFFDGTYWYAKSRAVYAFVMAYYGALGFIFCTLSFVFWFLPKKPWARRWAWITLFLGLLPIGVNFLLLALF